MALIDNTGAQSGDHTSRDAAGRDIVSNDPQPWLRYLWDVDQQRTRRDDELLHEIREGRRAMARLRDEFELYQAAIGNALAAVRERQRTDRILSVVALAIAALALALALLL